MNKLLIFDIDGTLCHINKAVDNELADILKELSMDNVIVFASGKPFGYIAGFCRQLGICNAIVIAENGATLMMSATFPPISYRKIQINKFVEELIFKIKEDAKKKFGNTIWFQPNEVNLTIFPIAISDISEVHEFARQYVDFDINVYFHKDSVDFTPKGFNKGTMVDVVLSNRFFSKKDIYIFGDGENDAPMFDKGDNIITIGNNKIFRNTNYIKLANFSELTEYLKPLLSTQI